jgi:predicted outer membrane repeat protein
VEFKGGTVFRSNFAQESGGAVHLNSPLNPAISKKTTFVSNTAERNGGAVECHHGDWSSSSDHYESNVARRGSGGAFYSLGCPVNFDEITSCRNNRALAGGGGCLLWEPEALNLHDDRWRNLKPTIGNMMLVTGNDALYGKTFATPGASLRLVDATKMTTNNQNILDPKYPKVEILDFYNSVVKGDFDKNLEVSAKLIQSKASLFGASVAKADVSGQVDFSALGIQGIPGSGPHVMYFESYFSFGSGGARRYANTTRFLETWIKECDENYFLDGSQCSKCRANSRSLKGSVHKENCICTSDYFLDDNICKKCPINSELKFDVTQGEMSKACSCNAGYYRKLSQTNDGTMTCIKCQARSMSLKNSTSKENCKCLMNKDIKTYLYQEECFSCPPNSQIVGLEGPVQNACACNENYYADVTETSMTCIKCDDDQTAPAGSSVCKCKKNLYYQNETKDENGDVVCIPCPLGADCSSHDGISIPELTALPGYWRPNRLSLVFSDCSKGYHGIDAVELAQQRCCAIHSLTNTSICHRNSSNSSSQNNTKDWFHDNQCKWKILSYFLNNILLFHIPLWPFIDLTNLIEIFPTLLQPL